MKTKNTGISLIIAAVTQSTRMRPALMTLTLVVVAALGVTGCQPHH